MVQSGIAIIFGSWAIIYLIDAFLKSYAPTSERYFRFLGKTGLSVSICQVRWDTAYFNRFFVKLGQYRPRLMKKWFTLGVYFSIVGMFVSVVILTLMVYNTLAQKPIEKQVLTPVMPGVNLPMSQVGYYLLTLLVCGILHEAGHAMAAVREQVRVNSFGLFVLAVYPGAYVNLCTEQLTSIAPIRQLRIFCAGVWHNAVIVVAAILILTILPWCLAPFYKVGNAVVITDVVANSAVDGRRGLVIGDQVTQISGCQVKNMESWAKCIEYSLKEKSEGFCMPLDLITEQDVSLKAYKTRLGNVECCGNTSNTHLCFFYNVKGDSEEKYSCLPARSTTERPSCKLASDCYSPTTPSTCVLPSLDNSTKLLKVYHTGKPPLLFLGHPLDLHYSVSMSDFVPAYGFVPVHLPNVVETLCKYLISLSGALALLNLVPCYALDGQWILMAFIESGLQYIIPSAEIRGLIYFGVLTFGTVLLGANLFIAMWMLFS